MSFASIKLPVPINVEHKKTGARTSTTKKTYNEAEFDIPSLNMNDVTLVAQWSQPWGGSKQTSSSDVRLTGGDWQQKLARAEHMVALIESNGAFYVPVRGHENEGAVQYLVTVKNAFSVLAAGLKTLGPFNAPGTLDLHPQHMGFNFRNHGVGREPSFAESGLPEGQLLVSTNEVERIEQMGRYLQANFIVVDDVLFSQVAEPMIFVRTGAEAVSMRLVTKHDEGLVALMDHYFRLDDLDRVAQMVEEHYSLDKISAQFSDLVVFDSEKLAPNFESSEAIRLARTLLDRVAPTLSQMNWEIGEPWYALKKRLKASPSGESDLDEVMSFVGSLGNAIQAHKEVDEEWRSKTARYARLGAERWTYRPITFSGPRI